MNKNLSWKEFEILVAAIYKAKTKGATVEWNAEIDGRQFDVVVRFEKGLHDYLTVVECKHYSLPVSVDKVEAFVTKSRRVKAHRAVMASSSGFQSGCLSVAKDNDIVLLTAEETYAEPPPPPPDAEPIVALNIYDVVASFADGTTYHLGDGTKLHYLMKHSAVIENGERKTLEEIVSKWNSKNVSHEFQEQDVSIDFGSDARFEGEDRAGEQIASLKFDAKLIDAYGTSTPTLDWHIQQNHLRKCTLRDSEGSVVSENFFSELALGAWNTVEPGKFYTQPAFESYYFCKSIDVDIISWILVESYQHGHRFGAEFTQKKKYQSHFVLVEDQKKLTELKARLEKLRSR